MQFYLNSDINNVNWLHFADCMNNGGTSELFIDFSPSDKGKKGQVIRFLHDQDSLEVIAESFDEFLDMIIKNDFKFIEEEEDTMGLFEKLKNNKHNENNLDSKRLNKIAEEGNELYKCGDLDNALKKYIEGYNLIPNPKNIYSESSWFEVAIGDIFFDNKNYEEALDYYEKAKNNIAGNGINNPYILFKYGASAFELNKNSEANEFLLRAYMLSGDDIFNDYDKKYFEFIKQNNKDIK